MIFKIGNLYFNNKKEFNFTSKKEEKEFNLKNRMHIFQKNIIIFAFLTYDLPTR
jgi:hypothetical protein